MVNISKKYLDENLKSAAWQKFETQIRKSINTEAVFRQFFTEKEIKMIEKRLAILVMLERGNSYLAIRHSLDVSPATISFIKHGFKKKARKSKVISGARLSSRTNKRRRKFPRYKGTRGLGLAEW